MFKFPQLFCWFYYLLYLYLLMPRRFCIYCVYAWFVHSVYVCSTFFILVWLICYLYLICLLYLRLLWFVCYFYLVYFICVFYGLLRLYLLWLVCYLCLVRSVCVFCDFSAVCASSALSTSFIVCFVCIYYSLFAVYILSAPFASCILMPLPFPNCTY